jgi:hypothetical protein
MVIAGFEITTSWVQEMLGDAQSVHQKITSRDTK